MTDEEGSWELDRKLDRDRDREYFHATHRVAGVVQPPTRRPCTVCSDGSCMLCDDSGTMPVIAVGDRVRVWTGELGVVSYLYADWFGIVLDGETAVHEWQAQHVEPAVAS